MSWTWKNSKNWNWKILYSHRQYSHTRTQSEVLLYSLLDQFIIFVFDRKGVTLKTFVTDWNSSCSSNYAEFKPTWRVVVISVFVVSWDLSQSMSDDKGCLKKINFQIIMWLETKTNTIWSQSMEHVVVTLSTALNTIIVN